MPDDSYNIRKTNEKRNRGVKPTKTATSIFLHNLEKLKSLNDAMDPFRNIRSATEAIRLPTMEGICGTGSLMNMAYQWTATNRALKGLYDIHKSWMETARLASKAAEAFNHFETFTSLYQKLDAMALTVRVPSIPSTGVGGNLFQKLQETCLETSMPVGISNQNSFFSKLDSANRDWQELIHQESAIIRAVRELEERHKSIVGPSSRMESDLVKAARFEIDVKDSLQAFPHALSETASLLAGISFDSISAQVGIGRPILTSLENSVDMVVSAYGNMISSFQDMADVVRLPNFILSDTTREIYSTGVSLYSLQTPAKEENHIDNAGQDLIAGDPECIALLESTAPDLIATYLGARESMGSSNHDSKRHLLISLRTLSDNILWRLAPESDVIRWATGLPEEKRKNLIKDNKPTRRGRIGFISRTINSTQISEFMNADTGSFLKLYDIFNHIHELSIGLTDIQIRIIMYKFESWLKFMLKIATSNF